MKNIKLVKLVNGSDLVAEIVRHDKENKIVVLKKPLQLTPTQQGLAATPFLLFSDDEEVEINTNNILCISNPTTVMIDSYCQETSGIALATPGDVPPTTPKLYTE